MEIQDIGLPSWTLQLPGGMVLKMGSAQGVLIIPDPVDAEKSYGSDADRQAALDELARTVTNTEIQRLKTALAEAQRTIRSLTAEREVPTMVEFDPTTDTTVEDS